MKATRLESTDLRKVEGYGSIKSTINHIRGLDREMVNDMLGFAIGRWNQLKSKIGIGNYDESRMIGELTDMLGEYLTAKTGAQRGMTEVRWLAMAMPSIHQNPEQFWALMDRTEDSVHRSLKAKAEAFGGARDVSPIYRILGEPVPPEFIMTPPWAQPAGLDPNRNLMEGATVGPAPAGAGMGSAGVGLDVSAAPLSVPATPDSNRTTKVRVIQQEGGMMWEGNATREELEQTRKQYPNAKIEILE